MDHIPPAKKNLFLIKEGKLYTPPVSAGILAGITRALVLEAAAEAGVQVTEIMLFPQDLYQADEAFITSSLREVLPVVMADGQSIGSGSPGPITRRLHEGYRRQVDLRSGAR